MKIVAPSTKCLVICLIATSCLMSSSGIASGTTLEVGRAPTRQHSGPQIVKATFDHCLVGTWIESSETDTLVFRGTLVTMHGLAHRTLVFARTGRETVAYTASTPLVGTYRGLSYQIKLSGTIVYTDSTSAGVLSFARPNYLSFVIRGTLGSRIVSYAKPNGAAPGPVRYVCTATMLRQNAHDYSAIFVRSS